MLQSFLNFLWSVIFFVSSTFGIGMSTEQQRYDVIEKIGQNLEIRQYPRRIVAKRLSTPTIRLIHEAMLFALSLLTFLAQTKRVKRSI